MEVLYQDRLPLPPHGKGRARHAGGVTYTPRKTEQWEADAALYIQLTWKARRDWRGPWGLAVMAVAPRPQKMARSKVTNQIWATKTHGDGDNILKAVADAVVKAQVCGDDAQTAAWMCMKRLANPGEMPHIQCVVWTIAPTDHVDDLVCADRSLGGARWILTPDWTRTSTS